MTIQSIKELKNPPHFFLINNDEELLSVCRQAQRKRAVALDTEFIRIRSYYPKLGLIQLYDGSQVSLIDPTTITDFSPLKALLTDNHVIKVLHACYEDLEVFHYYFNCLPKPMIDTQIMAAFLGFSNSAGLATLIQHYFKFEMDKDASRTDWLARPLSDKQLNYAAADVWYLLPLYFQMQKALQQTRWESAVEFDCNMLTEKILDIKDPEKAYLNIPHAWKLNSSELMRLKLLAKWRQEEAIKRDLALNFVVKGENLWQVAKYNPKHTSELLELGLNPHEVRIHGKKMLNVLSQMKRYQEKDYPMPICKLSDDSRYKKALKLLQDKLQEIAPPDLPITVISSKKGLEGMLKWVWMKNKSQDELPDLMKGWRQEYGIQLMHLIDG